MNSYVFISVVITAVSARDNGDITLETWKSYSEGDRYFFLPGDDGKAYYIDSLSDSVNCTPQGPIKPSYWLYTRSNSKKHILKMGDMTSVWKSKFDPFKITVFTVHGWKGNGNTEMNVLLTEAFLKNMNVNVIVLDWSTIASKCYFTARRAVSEVGRTLGQFINWIHETTGMSLDNVHLVGHSLGGHLVGNAGRELKGRVKRITALDPAGPFWYIDHNRLAKTDARYVEVIHTAILKAGYSIACGHSDHYPNGGSKMPGCKFWDISCHHARSWRYMLSSVEFNQLYGTKCSIWGFLFKSNCSGSLGLMGNSDINKQQSGVYKGSTTADYPYF